MRKYGIIMAGGSGTRFWPLSRQQTPKQLLNLTGNGIMINETIERLSHVAAPEDIFIVTSTDQTAAILEATVGRIPADHILAEPCARGTAACIGYAAAEILKKYGDGIMIVTPSDAYIRDTAAFTRVLNHAVEAAAQYDALVTVGISPTFPATGYGYIKYLQHAAGSAKPVLEFREKPDLATARAYVESGQYAWNSGMFIWRAGTLMEALSRFAPDIHEQLQTICAAMATRDEQAVLHRVYPTIRRISVDYAIMEPAAEDGKVMVVPGEFGWSDLGSWDMMRVLHPADQDGNVKVGNVVALDTRNSVLYASGKLVAVLGVEDVVVVETADAVMVCHKDQVQNVKRIVDALQAEDRTDLL